MKRYEIQHVYTGEVLSTVEAESPMKALDAYAVAEGFVPYSELPNDDDTEWTFTLDDGRLAGVFTNYAIAAREAKSDKELAEALLGAAEDEDDVALLEAEGAIIERLDISPDETEQGLTRDAVVRIEKFVSDATGKPWTYEDSGLLGVEGVQR